MGTSFILKSPSRDFFASSPLLRIFDLDSFAYSYRLFVLSVDEEISFCMAASSTELAGTLFAPVTGLFDFYLTEKCGLTRDSSDPFMYEKLLSCELSNTWGTSSS
jgi:hypothetical protein